MNIPLTYWKIALEIAILWYVVYMLLLFIKGTRTEQLLKGLVLIGVVFIVTQQLHLDAITWAMTRLFPISIIAFVIIFQPEMRKALARLGQLGIHEEQIEVIDEICSAALALSAKKIGALVVIEREVGLKSYLESGVPINGKVTSYLLMSIFIPQSPLHDGAVIIQHDTLLAAGCILPLSHEADALPKSFGMRHRAAASISEETDAVSVVVSEETGSISVAVNGKLRHVKDEQELKKQLRDLFYKLSGRKLPFRLR